MRGFRISDARFEVFTAMKIQLWSRDFPSPNGIATDYELDNQTIGVPIQAGAGNFCLRHRVQTGSGAHPASYSMGNRGYFPEGKAAEAWSWPFTSI